MAAYETLHLLPTAPPELVTAAYRCLAQRHHPDRGGDDEAMVCLNTAVACIRAHQASTRPRA
jgi:curved DNA-binding protein CbpA